MKRVIVFAFLTICVMVCVMTGSLPAKVYALPDCPIINSKSSVLIDYASGEVLFEQNAEAKLEVASMVKLMTIFLTIDALEKGEIALSDKLVVSEYASSMGGSQMFLDAGSSYTIEKMLESVIMASANDSSVALAEHLCGTEKNFVEKMNATAQCLGLQNTKYANATGLPAPMQFSTALDTAKLLSALVKNEVYHKFSSRWMDELVHPSGRKTEIVNTNKLTRYYKGCDCGKTGFTDEAGYCLSSSVARDDMRLVAVVMGAKSANQRFSESVALFNWGFSNFESNLIVDSQKPLGQVHVLKGEKTLANIFAKQNFAAVTRIGQKHGYEISYNSNITVCAPKQAGDVVGNLIVCKNGKIVKEIDIVLDENLDAISFGGAFNRIIKNW